MTFLADIQRIAVVGAQAHVGGRDVRQQRLQRVQILGDRTFADQNAHTFLELLQRLLCGGRLVLCANPRGRIGVQVNFIA